MTKLVAYHGDPAIKEKYLARVKAHEKADEIIQGTYWENGKGCAVGCTIEGNQHSKYETELGIPRMIARLEDRIFEGLTNGEAKRFPACFLEAIEPGADLSLVTAKFFVWMLGDPKDGVIKFATERSRGAIQRVVDLYEKKIAGESISEADWRDAADAAYAAADAAAAYAADAADAAYAADAAAADAAYAADAAAAAAAAAAAYAADAARRKHYKKMADKLLALLKEAK